MTDTEMTLASQLRSGSRDIYVGFVDLLGFSDRVKRDWAEAAAVYGAIMTEAARIHEAHRSLWTESQQGATSTMQTLSDSILIVGTNLIEVGSLAQAVQSAALVSGRMLVRGAIAFGTHAAIERPPHSYVVSQPLVTAAHLEAKIASYPRIILDRESGVEATAEKLRRAGHGLFIECEDGLWMVQPFSFALQQSAGGRDRYAAARDILEPLAAAYKTTAHSAKYDWMLSRVERVASDMECLADHPGNPANWNDE